VGARPLASPCYVYISGGPKARPLWCLTTRGIRPFACGGRSKGDTRRHNCSTWMQSFDSLCRKACLNEFVLPKILGWSRGLNLVLLDSYQTHHCAVWGFERWFPSGLITCRRATGRRLVTPQGIPQPGDEFFQHIQLYAVNRLAIKISMAITHKIYNILELNIATIVYIL
jgi:hypothetical protein